jgi:hypothetical protein
MLGAIAVSLNRTMYFGAALGLAVMVLAAGPRFRHWFAITMVTALAILVLVVQSTVLPAVTAQISRRASSALSSQVLSSNSARARTDEFSHALTTISHNP